MAINRADILHLDNGTVVDTAAGIDIRRLNSTAVAADETQVVQWTHTQDGTNRTFDPANAGVTVVADPQVFQGEGWALQLTADMTPADDTNCNAVLLAGTVAVAVDPRLNATGGTNLGGVNTINIRCSLWRYNPSTDTAVSIANGNANQTWDTSTLGAQNNTYRAVTVNISVASAVQFSQGEILLLQVGANATTLVDATLGTTTYDLTLRIGTATATRIDFAAGQSIAQVCVLTLNTVGEGTPTRGILDITQPRSVVGEGALTFVKAAAISKTFSLIGEAVPTRQFNVLEDFDLIGEAVPTMTRVVVASKSFSLIGEGVVTRSLALAIARSALGEGAVTFTKAVIASKTFDLIGEGVIDFVKFTTVYRTFNLVGEGKIENTGNNASTITLPIDEVPEGGGGTTVVVKPVYIFED